MSRSRTPVLLLALVATTAIAGPYLELVAAKERLFADLVQRGSACQDAPDGEQKYQTCVEFVRRMQGNDDVWTTMNQLNAAVTPGQPYATEAGEQWARPEFRARLEALNRQYATLSRSRDFARIYVAVHDETQP